jgi:serine/threonine protein kinase
MELLEGAPLEEVLEQGEPRSLNQKIDLVLQICDGLQAAHDRGISHGSLTPRRVFVQKDGSVKLLDVALGAAGDQASDLASAVSLFGAILGADAPQGLKDVLAKPRATAAELRADIEQARYVRNSGEYRTLAAAFDRYKKVEALIDERRTLGHRLKVADIDRICDEEAARLALRFPAFAQSAGKDLLPVSEQDETAALAELQSWHNEQLATVAVLRTASGEK